MCVERGREERAWDSSRDPQRPSANGASRPVMCSEGRGSYIWVADLQCPRRWIKQRSCACGRVMQGNGVLVTEMRLARCRLVDYKDPVLYLLGI